MKKVFYVTIGLLGFTTIALNGADLKKVIDDNYNTVIKEAQKKGTITVVFFNKTNGFLSGNGIYDSWGTVACPAGGASTTAGTWKFATLSSNYSYTLETKSKDCTLNINFELEFRATAGATGTLQKVKLETKGFDDAIIPFTESLNFGKKYNVDITGSAGNLKATLTGVE